MAEHNYIKMWTYIAKTLGVSKFEALRHAPADYLALVIDHNLFTSRENFIYERNRQNI